MKIISLRILPPIAIGRLGNDSQPMAAYDLEVAKEHPLDYRVVVPKETFKVDPKTGQLTSSFPKTVHFKTGVKNPKTASTRENDSTVHPVAPFLEVFAITDTQPKRLQPLTPKLLKEAGSDISQLSWNVEVGNIKVYRRTGDAQDKIYAKLDGIKDHQAHSLLGQCGNFITGKSLPLGTVQFIQPNDAHPEVRLRYTPGPGKVYGSSLKRATSYDPKDDVADPVITDEALVLYDIKKGRWRGYKEGSSYNPLFTNPAQIFAGWDDSDGNHVSWGYLDDECDGFVEVRLQVGKEVLSAKAHISAGPPAYAPDTLPIRVVSDELEQILLGPDVQGEVGIDEAVEIVRRSLETIRLMNTAAMNGNPLNGRLNVVSTMVRQNTNDFSRYYEPQMAPSIVDNLALRALHERVFNGLSTGGAAWFADVLRRPEEIADLSDEGVRKMPGLMRGADGRMLALTRRMIAMVVNAAAQAMFGVQSNHSAGLGDPLEADNLAAQLHYRGTGNPYAVLPRTAISNCFPGLEFDFRNFWRRAFKGIVLIENNNYVIGADAAYKHLEHCRLIAINGRPTVLPTQGPTFPAGSNVPLPTPDNPNAASFMEWSNTMAYVLQKQGQKAVLHFTKDASPIQVAPTAQDIKDGFTNPKKYQKVELEVSMMFEVGTATPSSTVLRPGELTQGLCAPWQNDYRECACYYWAASRPDYVNVEAGENGLSHGDHWFAKKRTGEYVPDNRVDSRLWSYDDLFINWQGELNFLIRGHDADQS